MAIRHVAEVKVLLNPLHMVLNREVERWSVTAYKLLLATFKSFNRCIYRAGSLWADIQDKARKFCAESRTPHHPLDHPVHYVTNRYQDRERDGDEDR